MSVNVQNNKNSEYRDSSNELHPKEPEPVVVPKPKRSSVIINEPPENVPHITNSGGPLTAEEMDEQRKQNIAYEYLCHLEEGKVWIQACINEDLPPTTELEEGLRNGVYLAKLAHFMVPSKVPLKRIYDNDQMKYKSRGLHFRHTDNLNLWFQVMEEMGFPRIFYPETTDIYDKKNMPRTIYCLHALSLYLFKLGMAPQIQDLYGKVSFSEEEISAMRQELDKYGIQMPTFSKIGGILANELSQDDAALHAAIIAINEAIESQVSADVMSALNNAAAKLVGINNILSDDYAANLYQAKYTKTEKSKNKSADEGDSKELDVYDEMLTHAEIQGNISQVNTIHALNTLNTAILNEDKLTILKYLKSAHLGIKNVKDENTDHYVLLLNEKRQTKKNNKGEDVALDKEDIQQVVNTANQEADAEYQKSLSVSAINEAIEMLNVTTLMKTLQHPHSQLPEISEHAGSLYMAEFKSMKEKKLTNLDYDDINGAAKVLLAIANINYCIDAGDPARTYAALTKDQASIANLDEENATRYQKNLLCTKNAKCGEPCDMLTHSEITAIIENTNTQLQEEHQRILAVSKINEYISRGNVTETLEMLKLLEAKLQNVDDKQAYIYQLLFTCKKNQKAEQMKDENVELWIDDIQDCIEKGNMLAREGVELSMGIVAINDAVDAAESETLACRLSHPGVGIMNVLTDCARTYLGELQKLKEKKQLSGNVGSGWMTNHTQDGSKFFFNKHTLDYHWCHSDSFIEDNSLLTKHEIQGVISAVNDACNREILFEANEDFIIKVQTFIRGYLARKTFHGRLAFLREQEPAVVRIQAFWRGAKQRKSYRERLAYFAKNTKFWVLLQAKVRMWLARKRYHARLKYFKDHETDIVKIQAFVRSNKARSDYRALLFETNPPLCVVQRFVQLRNTNDADYTEELELQHVKQQVVKEIKCNQQLEHDLDQMEVKIGLLVKNQIILQDVVMLNKKLAKQRETNGGATANHLNTAFPKELKSTLENHGRMEAYQQLFYLLQTYPTYLAKLIFVMPQDRTTKFIESVIYALFNYGTNAREEYFVVKLFKAALEEEIISRAEKITDIVTENPLVIKMIVGFNRTHRGQNALKEMLQPLITDLINDKDLKININPIEVYKVWVNQQESETGKTSVLPYNVTQEEALKHQEVCEKLHESFVQLQVLTEHFLTVILQSVDKIPYNMRYMAKLLQATLLKKFPDVQEREILKIIGNLLYYRYINPAILAPDVFDIIDVRADKALTSDQRRNLGSVAKVLQYATSNKEFDGDSSYLAHMNAYVKDCHEKFKKFCILACDVEEPEVKFNIDQYADVMMITKPLIYLSMQEIVDMHQLLLEHQDQIAPESPDPLHQLLKDLGEVPSGRELLGLEIGDIENLEEQIHAQLAKTEITLTLSNKFEVPEQDQTHTKTLLLRTKHMIVDMLACQAGDSLSQILETPATSEQEELHQALVKKRDRRDQHAASSEAGLIRHQLISKDCQLTIELMKAEIRESLQSLELQNVVSRTNDYQAIINLIAHDIRNQRRYRNNRKQELNRLRMTLKCLAEKRAFYEWQVDYYNQYVTTCTENLQQKGRSHKAKANKNAKKAHGTIKYSGAKLLEKGVVLEIEGLSQSQFKNAQFEIAATATAGVFSVSAKVMCIDVERVELIFQDLLQLQYEGVAIMEMFGRTKVNVNLLIFLINKKFYSGNK